MDILEKFKDYLKRNELKVPSFHPYFEEALNYMLQAGGKHFRAQLLLGVVSAVDERRFEGALAIAMALEMIHTYSLIH
ncbi:polyprenyl synthetase family protein, partial [uncultured Campylobacter sp.]